MPLSVEWGYYSSSGGSSKSTRFPRNPFVFHAPTAIPTAIQIAPKTQSFGAQTNPKKETDDEAQHRRNKIAELLFFLMQIVANEGRGIDSHESDQSAEIKQIRAKIVARSGSGQGGQ